MEGQGLIFKVGQQSFNVASVAEARAIWKRMRDDSNNGFGASDAPLNSLHQDGKKVGRLSYNGRAWKADGSEWE